MWNANPGPEHPLRQSARDNLRSSKRLPSIELAIIPERVLTALVAGSIDEASTAFGRSLPDLLLEYQWLWSYRLAQLREDPAAAPWLVRAVIGESGQVVGHAGFHGPPDDRGMVEVGYTIYPPWRRRGYATAALAALIDEAVAAPQVAVVLASISPDNDASLATIAPFGFVQVGEQMDEIDGLELVFELQLRSLPSSDDPASQPQ